MSESLTPESSTSDLDAVAVVQQWHDAVNARDIEAAVALCREDVAVGGPQGSGQGLELMRRWLTRSGITLKPQHPLTGAHGRLVVHELAQWRPTADAPVQAPTDAPADTWVVFEVRDGQLTAVSRYESSDQVPGASG